MWLPLASVEVPSKCVATVSPLTVLTPLPVVVLPSLVQLKLKLVLLPLVLTEVYGQRPSGSVCT